MSEILSFIRDAAGRCCPECKSTDLYYQEVDASYGPYTQDYECQNCGCEWMMAEPDPHHLIMPFGDDDSDDDPRYTLTPLGAAMLEGKKNDG